MTNKEKSEYCGFSLFNDIEDGELKKRNRSVILANIAEQYLMPKTNKITTRGASLIIGYFRNIPLNEREALLSKFKETMKERNFILES